MRVFYDSQIFFMQKHGGISNYFAHLIKEYFLHPDLGIEPILSLDKCYNNHLLEICSELDIEKIHKNTSIFRAITNASFNSKLAKGADLIHFTYYLPSLLLHQKKVPKISTIHDFIPENYFSRFNAFRYSHYLKKSYIKKSSGLIFVSNTSLNLFMNNYSHVKKDRLQMIYHGVEFSSTNYNILPTIEFKRPFFLFVGSRKNYKNFDLLLKAFSQINNFSEVDLLCFGGPKFSKYEIKTMKHLKITKNVFYIDTKYDNLIYLYKNAIAFINPSKDEGFGLTNLEAFSFGCRVVCSDIPIFREILGDNAIYFDPNSILSLKNALTEILISKNLPKLSSSLIDHAHKFSWHNTAINTANFYKRIVYQHKLRVGRQGLEP